MKVLKIIGYLFLTIVGSILIYGGYNFAKSGIKYWNTKLITITVSYDLYACSVNEPLLIRIRNGSDKTLKQFFYHLSATRKGYSNNVVAVMYGTSPKNYNTLKPGWGFKNCVRVPKITQGSAPDLIWKASIKPYAAKFEDE